MSFKKIPGQRLGIVCSDPSAESMIALLGGQAHSDVTFSNAQKACFSEFYGYKFDSSMNELEEAGATQNMFRHVQRDGLRVMGLLSRYLDKGQDPVNLLATLLLDAGYDTAGLDPEWFEEYEKLS